ncbi:hypothetical protein F4555_001541 [Mobiluncus mulieris]|nr:hypothetical protein HMPREF0577_0186 [Mobiluncus mulieris ATCC 35243]MBB5846745.1 hypothetical protein [Mobiluncus mulieris]
MFLIRVLGLNPPGRIRACWGCWVALGVLGGFGGAGGGVCWGVGVKAGNRQDLG